MNNKGFTIIELIATILILALVLGIGSYSVISLIRESRERNYETLIVHIKSAVETYDIECMHASNESITCGNTLTLGKLVQYGYLSGNAKVNNESDANYTIVNPRDNKSIANCNIKYTNNNGVITITAVNPSGSCPTEY